MPRSDRFLKACRREPVDTTPVWLMRQAGRYMAEYRALREKYPILDVVKTPELAAEVTFQPINAFDLDAAIIFADILPILEPLGLDLEFVRGRGPVLHNPIRSPADVARLAAPDPEQELSFTLDAIRLVRAQLEERAALIGFSGAPFTLACYAIEGGGSRDFSNAKSFMHSEPESWHTLMEILSEAVGTYLKAQAAAGAQALQLFDGAAGMLSPEDYRTFVLPYTQQAVQTARTAGVPVIHFSMGTFGILPLIESTGPDVISVDWRVDLADAWARLGFRTAIQGNLDPGILAGAPTEVIQQHAAYLLDRVGGRPGHIFNLGHGVLRQTPVEQVSMLVDFVHTYARSKTDSGVPPVKPEREVHQTEIPYIGIDI